MKRIFKYFFCLELAISAISCRTDSRNEKLKNVGQSAAKVLSGLKVGIEKVSKINIELSESLKT